MGHITEYTVQTKHNRNKKKKNMPTYDETITEQQRLTSATCICGEYLLKVNDIKKKVIRCYNCNKTIKRDKIFFHCRKQYIDAHKEGYHICQECAVVLQCSKSHCNHLSRFVDKMNEYRLYNNNKVDQIMKEVDLSQIVRRLLCDYFHLLERHKDDVHFENAVSKTEKCNIDACVIFRRNYRDRCKIDMIDEEKKQNQMDEEDMFYNEIIDKMHCYFYHSYDIGNRIRICEQKLINECKTENEFEELLINTKIAKTYKILAAKRSNFQPMYNRLRNSKYNQLVMIQENDEKLIEKQEITNNNQKVFEFGYKFSYADYD
eukprot:41699_1